MGTDTSTSDDMQANIDSNLVFVAIYEASDGPDFTQLDDPESPAAQVARGRGKGTLLTDGPSSNTEDTDADTEEDNDDTSTPPSDYLLELQEGKISTKSGYVMRFVTKEHLDLSFFDVLTIPDLQSYPLPEDAYETLPVHVRGYLKENGYAKIRGGYDHDNSQFFGVQRGWEYDESEEIEAWDRLPELIRVLGSEQAAIDYLLVDEGPDRWDAERLAEVRDVTERAVTENLRLARAELNE